MNTITTAALSDTFIIIQCPECGCFFGVAAQRYEWFRWREGTAKEIYCPNGHGWYLKKPEPEYRCPRKPSPTVLVYADTANLDGINARLDEIASRLANPQPIEPPPSPKRRAKPFCCEKCGKRYAYQSGLDAHNSNGGCS